MKAITHLFEESVAQFANNPYLWEKKTDKFEPSTYSEVKEKVYQFAAGLMSIGMQKGDRVALISEGRNDWVISELGVLYAGAINVPLSVKLGDSAEIIFRLEHSGATMIIASQMQARKLKNIKNQLNNIKKLILLDADTHYDEKDILFTDILELGKKFLVTNYSEFEGRWKSVSPNDYANICYTSGTTADPKGIILTHRNYTANVEQGLNLLDIAPNYVTLLILPWDHAFAHTAGIYTFMKCGASIASVQVGKTPMDALKNIPINIKEVKPHILFSVPALAKNFRKNIENGIRSKGRVTSWLFTIGLKIGYIYNGNGFNKGKEFRCLLKPLVVVFDKIIFSKVREAFGGRLKFFIGGGALLDIQLQRFFYAIGTPMHQGYGLTEAAPIISSNVPKLKKIGSSGNPVKPMDLKICDDTGNELPIGEKGEIVVRGENIMAGYWDNPIATSQSLKDGWLFTGDRGLMDTDGFLFVFGRFKSLLISDDGEKYSPEGIEEAFIGQSPYIEQCMLYNNQNPYTIALIYPNKEAIKRWLKLESLTSDTEEGQIAILKMIESEINEYRIGHKHGKMFPQRWLPSAIGILQEGFTENNQLLNSTLKIVRPKIVEYHKTLIDYLYTPEAKDICNARNMYVLNSMELND